MMDHTPDVWLSVVLAVGLFLCMKAIDRWFRARRVPRRFDDWQDAVEEAATSAIRAHLHATDCQRRLVELIGALPKDFDPVIWTGARLADGVQRAALGEAVRQGIVDARVLEDLYPGSTAILTPSVEVDGAAAPPDPWPPTQDLEIGDDPGPNVIFLDGRPIPRTAANER